MIFKRKISKWEAGRALRDSAMRRALLKILQDETTPENGRPDPMRDDEDIEEELKRILGK